jgi:hypothetical protein
MSSSTFVKQNILNDCSPVFAVIFFQAAETLQVLEGFQIAPKPHTPSLNNL